jgi:hypothetical protein
MSRKYIDKKLEGSSRAGVLLVVLVVLLGRFGGSGLPLGLVGVELVVGFVGGALVVGRVRREHHLVEQLLLYDRGRDRARRRTAACGRATTHGHTSIFDETTGHVCSLGRTP